jgi:hypothetical protein
MLVRRGSMWIAGVGCCCRSLEESLVQHVEHCEMVMRHSKSCRRYCLGHECLVRPKFPRGHKDFGIQDAELGWICCLVTLFEVQR